jgi:hypothetical protein
MAPTAISARTAMIPVFYFLFLFFKKYLCCCSNYPPMAPTAISARTAMIPVFIFYFYFLKNIFVAVVTIHQWRPQQVQRERP